MQLLQQFIGIMFNMVVFMFIMTVVMVLGFKAFGQLGLFLFPMLTILMFPRPLTYMLTYPLLKNGQ